MYGNLPSKTKLLSLTRSAAEANRQIDLRKYCTKVYSLETTLHITNNTFSTRADLIQ